jgi:hypothetical protein
LWTCPLFLCQGLTVFAFATLEILLCLCRWNWLFVRSLPELGCGLWTQMISMGTVPLAVRATLLWELLTKPSINLDLWKWFLVLQGHLHEGR